MNSPVELDKDIESFTLSDLNSDETAEIISDISIQKAQEIGSSHLQCHAISAATNPKRRKQCIQARKKGSILCHGHSKAKEVGKNIVLASL